MMPLELMTRIESAAHRFSNGYVVVNASPYPLKFVDGDKMVIINSTGITIEIDELDGFRPSEEGRKILESIKRMFPKGVIIDYLCEPEKWHDIECLFDDFAMDFLQDASNP